MKNPSLAEGFCYICYNIKKKKKPQRKSEVKWCTFRDLNPGPTVSVAVRNEAA